MSKTEKLIARFKTKPKDFTWDEMISLLNYFGYEEIRGSGSRRKFIHDNCHLIILHKPHPRKILKIYQIEQVYAILTEENLL
ncbi:MAG: type II toxin-antitoxin system HicA family toxin [Candidatus Omnitrophica bacterium]|nr:type II toxin-antitoxin system HicA family toxin [Candidatus Omnitrophota bacterium]